MARIILLLLMVRSILSKQIECYDGIEYTKNGEDMKERTGLVFCAENEQCVSGKGSFDVEAGSCEFFLSFFNLLNLA